MKKIHFNIIFCGLILLLFSSCIKNDEITFTNSVVEFDAAAYNAKASGLTYPVLTRLPAYGRTLRTSTVAATTLSPSAPADALLTRASGAVKFRVNLLGPQRNSDIVMNYKVLAESTAVAGTHYSTGTTVTIPANTSFGEITVQILNSGVSSPTSVRLVLELEGVTDVLPNQNYKAIALSIAQN